MKKILAVLIASVMLLSVGCSKKPVDEESKNTTSSNETEVDTPETVNHGKEIDAFFFFLVENYTVKESNDEKMTVVFSVPDFYELSKLARKHEKLDFSDFMGLSAENPDVVKEIEITMTRDDDLSLKEKLQDAVILDMLHSVIGSMEIDLSDPEERANAEAKENENN